MKIASAVFGVLGGLLAALGLAICLTQRNAPPRLLAPPRGAEECVRGLVEALSAGDYSAAAQYLYGTPSLRVDMPEADTDRLLWDAFTDSLRCAPAGACYASPEGLAQDVTVQGLSLTRLLRRMEQTAPAVLRRRVAQAQSMEQVYDDAHEYRPEFIRSVLHQAARECLEGARPSARRLKLRLVYDGAWWVAPDGGVLSALSGGVLGGSAQ